MKCLYLLFAIIHAAAILEEVVLNHNAKSVIRGKNSFDKNQFGNMETPVDI